MFFVGCLGHGIVHPSGRNFNLVQNQIFLGEGVALLKRSEAPLPQHASTGHSTVAPAAYQVILEPGMDQFIS